MDAGLIAMRMRLSGGKEVAAEAETATAAVKETEAATESANRKSRTVGNGIRQSLTSQITAMRTIGRSLTKYVTVPLAAIAIGSGVMAAHFDRSMNLVATDAGGSVKEVAKLKGEVLDLARHSQFGPQKLADSLFHVESSGYRGAKAIRVLNEAQKLATAGNSDLESTTYALVSAQKALSSGDSLKGVTKTAAQLNEIVSHGDIRLEELTSAMSTGLLPTAKALGLSVADVGSALDVMTKRGIPAQRSAYALNFTLQKLIPSTEKAEKAFKGLGIGEEELLKTAQTKGLPVALDLLKEKLSGLTRGHQIQVIDEMFGGGRMSKGLLVAIQHVGEMKELWGQVDGNVGLYKKHVREAENQPLVKAKVAWSSIEAGLIEIGQVLLPAAIPLMEHVASILAGFSHTFAAMPASTQHTVVAIAAIAAALGPVLLLTAKLLELWKSISALSMIGGTKGGIGITKGRAAGAAGGLIASQTAGSAIGGKAGSAVSNIGTGAALGFGVGGPWGAAAGAGLGALMTFGPSLMDLLGTEKKVNPMQAKLASSARGMTAAYRGAHNAVRALKGGEEAITRIKHNHHEATIHLKKAEHELSAIRQRSGPNSHAAIQAEVRLGQAVRGVTRARQAQKRAEREHGTELQVTKEKLRYADLEERHRINILGRARQAIEAKRQAMKNEGASFQELQPINERWTKVVQQQRQAHQKLAQTILEAGHVAGPKWAGFLKTGQRASLEYGSKVKATRKELQTMKTTLRELQITIRNTSNAFEEGVLGSKSNVLREGIRGAEEELESLPHGGKPHGHPHGGAHHRKTAAEQSSQGSAALQALLTRQGRSDGQGNKKTIVLALDRKGRKKIAEFTVDEEDDARARR